MIIDDEPLALESMKKMLDSLASFERLETFANPLNAVHAANTHLFDAAFIDIEMAELTGLETAKLLLDVSPDMAIVFVTAYREYAVDAYELSVLDYVVKPVQRQRLDNTLARVRAFLDAKSRGKEEAAVKASIPPRIKAFRRLELYAADETTPVTGWRTMRAQELFAYFVFRRGEVVPKDFLLELFWTDQEPEKGASNLYTTISIIRRQLKAISDQAVLSSVEDGYRLDLGDIVYDVGEWEKRLAKDKLWKPDEVEQMLESFGMYRGDFLEEHPYDWAEPERHRLRLILFQLAQRLGEWLVKEKRYTEASKLFWQIKQRFPLVEYGYFELMKLGATLGDHGMVTREFDLLSARLHEELNESPSAGVFQWYDNWRRRNFS